MLNITYIYISILNYSSFMKALIVNVILGPISPLRHPSLNTLCSHNLTEKTVFATIYLSDTGDILFFLEI